MRRILIFLAVLGQLAVLLGMAGQREWITHHGRHIFLRTAPYDPTDYMRGKYARLNYEISAVAASLCRDGVQAWFAPSESSYRLHRDERVYAILREDENDDAHLVALTDQEPASGLYLRGRVDSVSGKWIRVRYGIEALFMAEDEAAKMDGTPAEWWRNVPLDAEVVVSKSGTGVLQKTKPEPLALSLQLERIADGTAAAKPDVKPHRLAGVTAKLTNYGPSPVTVVLRPNGKSFRLIAISTDDEPPYFWVNEKSAPPPATADDVKTIAPGASVTQHIDLNDPYWALRPSKPAAKSSGDELQLSALASDWGQSYRLDYTPGIQPSDALHHIPYLSTRVVSSRAFTPAGTD